MEVAEVTSARLTDELVELWRDELVERDLRLRPSRSTYARVGGSVPGWGTTRPSTADGCWRTSRGLSRAMPRRR